MSNNPVVSVIMPSYNTANFIAEAIASVIDQTYKDWELLIVDDASADASVAIISKFVEKDSRIKLFHNSANYGAAATRNKALKMAKGEFIAFLDADDLWKKEKLSKQLKFCLDNNVNIVFSSYDRIDEHSNSLNQIVEALPFVNYEKLLRSNYIGHLTGMYNAKCIGRVLQPNIRKRQDWAMWLQVIKKGGTAHGMQDSLACYRLRKSSMSQNKWSLLSYNYRIYNEVLGYGKIKSFKWILMFLKEHFFVKSRQLKSMD